MLFLCGSDGPGKLRIVTAPFFDRVIRKGDQGFSDYRNQAIPIESVGHGIGTLNHEPPWLAENDLTELVPGMTLCVEVGCYGTDMVYYGNMPEGIWLVPDKGLELIGVDLPREIWLCG